MLWTWSPWSVLFSYYNISVVYRKIDFNSNVIPKISACGPSRVSAGHKTRWRVGYGISNTVLWKTSLLKTPTKNNLNELKDLRSGKLMPYCEKRNSSEVTRSMDLLTTRAIIKIHKSNIRTMLETGGTSQIARIRRYNFAVLRLSEIQWAEGKQKGWLWDRCCCTLIDHEEENASHTQVFTLMPFKIARKAHIGSVSWVQNNRRILQNKGGDRNECEHPNRRPKRQRYHETIWTRIKEREWWEICTFSHT